MTPESVVPGFFIWGIDHAAYGPVELPTLVNWIKDDRVQADTWVFSQRDVKWQPARTIPELQMFFRPKAVAGTPSSPGGVRTGVLRRVKILGNLDEAQLERFASFMELVSVPQWRPIVQQGELGDSMFMILEGELRARFIAGGKETILATFGPGDFFGDLSLFDHGPRSADVVANVDSTVLKMSAAGFEKLAREAPELAAPFLSSVIKTLAARIRADNKRLKDAHSFANAAGSVA